MGDYKDFINSLSKEANDNFYNDLSGIAELGGKSAIEYAKQPDADIGEALLYSSILGMLGGGFGELGSRKGAADLSMAADVLYGKSAGRPEGMSRSLYKNALTMRELYNRDRAQKWADEAQTRRWDREDKYLEELDKIGLIPRKNRMEQLQHLKPVVGEAPAGGVVGYEKLPTHPDVKDQISNIEQLSNRFRTDTLNYRRANMGLRAMVDAFQDPSGTSDYELIRRAAQAVEPGLAVRKDDEDSIIGAASVLGMTTQAVKNAISGDTKLDAPTRAGLMRIGVRGYKQQLADFAAVAARAKRQGNFMGITDPSLYMDILEAEAPEAIWPLATKSPEEQVAAAQRILGQGGTSTQGIGPMNPLRAKKIEHAQWAHSKGMTTEQAEADWLARRARLPEGF